jgi:hypothetical protein
MLNKSNQKRAIAVATVAAIFMMAGLARADDGGAEDYMIPASFVAGEPEGGAATCADLVRDAWFQRELERTDGDVSPEVQAVSCRPDIYAESTVDAD